MKTGEILAQKWACCLSRKLEGGKKVEGEARIPCKSFTLFLIPLVNTEEHSMTVRWYNFNSSQSKIFLAVSWKAEGMKWRHAEDKAWLASGLIRCVCSMRLAAWEYNYTTNYWNSELELPEKDSIHVSIVLLHSHSFPPLSIIYS